MSLSIILVACAQVLNVPTPYVGNKLVIFGVLTPDSIPTLVVTRTYPTVGAVNLTTSTLTQASVFLLENGRLISQLQHQGHGLYQAPKGMKVSMGKAYSYSVTAAGFSPVQSDYEQIPAPPLSFSATLEESIISPLNASYPSRKIHCQFSDETTTTDYYSVEFEAYSQGSRLAFNSFGLDRPDDVEDGCGFRSRNKLGEYNLRDVCFNTGTGSLNVGVELEGSAQSGVVRGKKLKAESIVVTLRRTNRGYQEFNRTFYVESDDPFQAFDPPKVRYSNVKGGYGFIGAYGQTKISMAQT